MSTVVLLHSVLGMGQGELDAADRLRADGHQVLLPDLFEGRTFDAYQPAMPWPDELGVQSLFDRGLAAVAEVPNGFVVGGFSQGSTVASSEVLRQSSQMGRQAHGASTGARSTGRSPAGRAQPTSGSRCAQAARWLRERGSPLR